MTSKNNKEIAQEEQLDERETMEEIIELKAAEKASRVKISKLTNIKKSAEKTRIHLTNALKPAEKFLRLSRLIYAELYKHEKGGGRLGPIVNVREAGRVAGTARFIRLHIYENINELTHITNGESKNPGTSLRNINAHLKDDIRYLVVALRYEKEIESSMKK